MSESKAHLPSKQSVDGSNPSGGVSQKPIKYWVLGIPLEPFFLAMQGAPPFIDVSIPGGRGQGVIGTDPAASGGGTAGLSLERS